MSTTKETQQPSENPRSSPSSLATALLGLTAIVWAIGLCINITPAADIFWQMRTGGEIVTQHMIPHMDTFSYTRAGTPWVAHEWPFFVAMWESYRLGGYAGLWLLEASFVGLIAIVLFRIILKQTSGAPLTAFLLTLFATVVGASYFQPRPHLVTSLGVTLVMGMCLSVRRENPRRVYLLLPAFALWSNMHAGVLAGVAELVAFVICDALEVRFRSDLNAETIAMRRESIRHMAIAAVLGMLVTLATPYSWHVYQNFRDTLGSSTLTDGLSEWQSTNLHSEAGKLVEALIAVILIAMGASRQKRDLAEIVILAVLAHEALVTNRNVSLLAFAGTPLVARHVQSTIQRAFHRGPEDTFEESGSLFGRTFGLVPAVAVAAAFACITMARVQPVLNSPDSVPSRGLERLARLSFVVPSFPATACDFIRKEKIPASLRLYNIYVIGGYIDWALPDHKVFIDGRTDLYIGDMLDTYAHMLKLPFDWEAVLKQHDCDVIISTVDDPQTRLFIGSPDWAVVFLDRPNLDEKYVGLANGIILVRRSAMNAAEIVRLRHDCPTLEDPILQKYSGYKAFL